MDNFNDYKNLSSPEDKLEYIDKNINEILKPYGLKMTKHSLPPKKPSSFIFFKKPNIIILKEDNISDEWNYVTPLKYTISMLNEEFELFSNDEINFIYLMEFPIHHLIIFLIHLSHKYKINLYFPQDQIEKYKLKELENDISEKLENDIIDINLNEESKNISGNLNILNLDDAVKSGLMITREI